MTQSNARRVVVVGASSGIGRGVGLGLAARGDAVAFVGRRADRVAGAAQEAGPGSIGIAGDVTDEASCRQAIERAAEYLGGIDALVYAAGIGRLRNLVDTDALTWREILDTNVVGASIATAAALPYLVASATGVALYLTSVSASVTPPWPGLGAYGVSKAALDKLIDAWRGEHPELRFTRVVVGDTGGGDGLSATEFATGWDADLFTASATIWFQRGYLAGALIDIDDLTEVVDVVVGSGASIPSVTVTPRPPGR
jgi:NAD(P)-dependent dehydrogenase (short-subunit alcohol dehydrogenase family)